VAVDASQLSADLVTVTVPATSANLGPGFDTLGIALDLRDEIQVQIGGTESSVSVSGQGAGFVPEDENHLVLRALRRTLAFAGVAAPQPSIQMRCINRIPHGRGLGSSAAAVVGGIAAANQLLPAAARLSPADMLQLATEFEGHPDNAAPAILGGLTISWLDAEFPQAQKLADQLNYRVTVLVPDATLSTKLARAALPQSVPFADAVFNLSRTALLISQLCRTNGQTNTNAENSNALIFTATQDRLHQPYRAAAMPESARLVTQLRRNGLAAVISGAGPSIVVFEATGADTANPDNRETPDLLAVLREIDMSGWRVLPLGVSASGVEATTVLSKRIIGV